MVYNEGVENNERAARKIMDCRVCATARAGGLTVACFSKKGHQGPVKCIYLFRKYNL